MKQVIVENRKTQVTPNELDGNEIAAYHSQNQTGYAVLSKLEPRLWGFVHLHLPATKPVYCGETYWQSIELASRSRDVRIFDTMDEMLEAMLKRKF